MYLYKVLHLSWPLKEVSHHHQTFPSSLQHYRVKSDKEARNGVHCAEYASALPVQDAGRVSAPLSHNDLSIAIGTFCTSGPEMGKGKRIGMLA